MSSASLVSRGVCSLALSPTLVFGCLSFLPSHSFICVCCFYHAHQVCSGLGVVGIVCSCCCSAVQHYLYRLQRCMASLSIIPVPLLSMTPFSFYSIVDQEPIVRCPSRCRSRRYPGLPRGHRIRRQRLDLLFIRESPPSASLHCAASLNRSRLRVGQGSEPNQRRRQLGHRRPIRWSQRLRQQCRPSRCHHRPYLLQLDRSCQA